MISSLFSLCLPPRWLHTLHLIFSLPVLFFFFYDSSWDWERVRVGRTATLGTGTNEEIMKKVSPGRTTKQSRPLPPNFSLAQHFSELIQHEDKCQKAGTYLIAVFFSVLHTKGMLNCLHILTTRAFFRSKRTRAARSLTSMLTASANQVWLHSISVQYLTSSPKE